MGGEGKFLYGLGVSGEMRLGGGDCGVHYSGETVG